MNNSIIDFLLRFFKKESVISDLTLDNKQEANSRFYASVKQNQETNKKYNNPKILRNNPEFQKIINNLRKRIKIDQNLESRNKIYTLKKDKENAL